MEAIAAGWESEVALSSLPRSPLPTELTLERDGLVSLLPATCGDQVEHLGDHLPVRAHRNAVERTGVAEVHSHGVTRHHTDEADGVGVRPVERIAYQDATLAWDVHAHGDLLGDSNVGVEAAEQRVPARDLPGGTDNVAHLTVPWELIELRAREHDRALDRLAVPDLHALVGGGTRCLGQHPQEDPVGVGIGGDGHDGSSLR